MRNGPIKVTVLVAMAGLWACGVPRTSPVTGLTRVVECGGAPREDGGSTCQPPRPASGTVTVTRDGHEVVRAPSSVSDGFRLALAPGTYDLTAILDGFGEVAWCDTVPVAVGGRPPAPVVITCTVAYP